MTFRSAVPGVDDRLMALLVCPADHGRLIADGVGLRCARCTRSYEVRDGIPLLVDDPLTDAHDEIHHLIGSRHADEHRRRQAAFFDETEAAEFEITRPQGTPALYAWLLHEKLRRAVRGIESLLPGAMALVVCGGSGMDAEYLARRGATVICADISYGAARRAAERARRHGLAILPVVADAEHLPFASRTIGTVAVHDGLHHLQDPRAALVEMARVADRAVSVTEPARAFLTAVAVRLGLALDREEAGNRVMRLRLDDVIEVLRSSGFMITSADRYAMYYRHVPGSAVRVLSFPLVFPLAKGLILLANRFVGFAGNKLSVVAIRRNER